MSTPKLKAGFWVQAQVRICDLALIPIAIRRRGDPDAGAVLLKLNRLDETATVLSQVRTLDGAPAWLRATGEAPVPDADAEAYIDRQVARDPDLWVIEIEDADGKYEFDAEIVS